MKFSKGLAAGMAFALSLSILAGYGSEIRVRAAEETTEEAAQEKDLSDITIGVSIFTRTHVFYNRVEEAMQKKMR